MGKLTVVIPIYKTEGFLRECLDSVINQTYKDLEIICVNDASPDNSLSILKEYEARDSRIKVISHSSNIGLSAARNTGIEQATSKFITFVDSDDTLNPKAYELAMAKMDKVDMIYFGINIFGDAALSRRSDENKTFEVRVKGVKKHNDKII